MKIAYILIFLMSIFGINNLDAQNTISFSYNSAGGMTERKLQVIPQPGARMKRQTGLVDSTFVDFKVYPNPTNSNLNIEGPLPSDVKEGKITFLNATGQFIKSDVYSGQLKTISVAELSKGVYFMEIKFSEKEAKSYKIIVSN